MEQETLSRLKVKLKLDFELYNIAVELSADAETSLSDCIENMILLAKGIYIHDKSEDIIFTMRKLKCAAIANAASLRTPAPKRSCHLTLHPEAVSFASYLRQTYPPVFSSLNEAYELCMRYCCQFCDEKSNSRYLLRRLSEVRKSHS